MDRYDQQLEEIRARSVEVGVDLNNLRSGDLGALNSEHVQIIAALEAEALELAQQRMLLTSRNDHLREVARAAGAAGGQRSGARRDETRRRRLAVRSATLGALLLVIAAVWQSLVVTGLAVGALIVAALAWSRSISTARREVLRSQETYAERAVVTTPPSSVSEIPSNPQSSKGNGCGIST